MTGPERPRPAVFLDRDGTVIEHVHYLADPTLVRPIPGAVDALRKLREAGYALVIVTNQSAIARGYLTVEGLARVHDEMVRQLADEGVELDGIYFCPEAPTVDDPTVITHPDRKPGPGMLLSAAADLGLDLPSSWMIGDMISDALAGENAGCRGSILVETGKGLGADDAGRSAGYHGAADLLAAAALILETDARIERGPTR